MKTVKEMFNESLHNKRTWIPNLLTSSRLVSSSLVPIMFLTGNYIGAVGLGLYGAISDCLDGFCARKLNGYSDFGKYLDAVSDKIFALGLAICVLPTSPILLLNAALESTISLINLKSYKEGNEPSSSLLGKAKTWLLFSSIGLCFLSHFFPGFSIASNIACLATAGVQSVVAIDYYKKKKEKDKDKENKNNVTFDTKQQDEIQEEKKIKEEVKDKEITSSSITTNIDYSNKVIDAGEKPKVLTLNRYKKNY